MADTDKSVQKVIDLEQDVDGVYKPKAIRHIHKKKEEEQEDDLVPIEARESNNPKLREFINGWDMGMSFINHFIKRLK